MTKRATLSILSLALAVGCAEAEDDFGAAPSLDPSGEETTGASPKDDDVGDETGGYDEPEEDTDDPGEPEDHSDAVDEFIFSLGHLDLPAAQGEHPIPCDPLSMECPAPWQVGEQLCELQWYETTEHKDTFIALQPDSPALWPGAVVRGADVAEGFLSPIGLERAPATVSLSLENLSASPVAQLEAPSLSAFRDARNDILSQGLDGNTPAQLSYEIHRVASRSQLSIHIGASVDWASVVDFDAMFDFDDDEFTNRYLIDFTQTYYTADLDAPARPSDLFDDAVSVEDLSQIVGVDNPPMYVQSVSYGRRVLFAIESNDELGKIVAAFDAAFGGAAELEADVEAKETLSSAKITAAVLGGDAQAAVKTILGAEEMITYITEGGNYSADSPGVPIGFRVSYLDNASTRLALTAQFAETVCQ